MQQSQLAYLLTAYLVTFFISWLVSLLLTCLLAYVLTRLNKIYIRFLLII